MTLAAHFASSLWLLRHRPVWRLEEQKPTQNRANNETTNNTNTDTKNKHETNTQATQAAARALLAAQPPERPRWEVANALMAGPLGRSGWPLAYWSKARLFSVDARRGWVDADLKPFDPGEAAGGQPG